MAKKLAPLPRVTTKTITVGALLKKIKRLILEEPLRLDMGDWVKAFKGESLRAVPVEQPPACGTVACMAGWGALLLRPDRVRLDLLQWNADEVMTEALGFDYKGYREVGGLFSDAVVIALGDSGFILPEAGTTEHAAVIAKRIDTYLSQHPEIVSRKIIVANVRKALRAYNRSPQCPRTDSSTQ